jgi:hypothetical protein
MPVRFYTKKELCILLRVSEEYFHSEIKKIIKKDFKSELKVLKVENPDILLDENNFIFLADPKDHNNFFETFVNIFDYI